jgi:hypothetical protein
VAVDGESFTSTLPYRVPVAVQLRRLLGILWILADKTVSECDSKAILPTVTTLTA